MKKFTKQEILELYGQVTLGEISISRMVEIINERVSEAEKNCVENIPKRKFKKGDKVRIKDGVSSKTHKLVPPFFTSDMDDFIGTTMTVYEASNMTIYVDCYESVGLFHEDWLELYVEELKKGDLAIFWDDNKRYAVIKLYERLKESEEWYYKHEDNNRSSWRNAIKFESREQYEKLLKGEL